MNKKILLVGGSGFAGRSITGALVEDGYEVHVFSRRADPGTESPHVHYYQRDIRDIGQFEPLLTGCRDILYFASDTTPGISARDPLLEVQDNLTPLLTLIKHLQHQPDKHLIYLSSGGTVYGNVQKSHFNEQDGFAPTSYYGAGKVAAEAFLQSFQAQYGTRVSILRPSNFYGIGQPYKSGFGVIRSILECLYNQDTFQIWGDGKARRDYLNIRDFVSACLILLRNPPAVQFNVFNVASGRVISLVELLTLIQETVGRTLDVHYRPGRSCDIESIALDCSKLNALNWKAEITLEAGIRDMWQWLCNEKKS